MKYQKVSKHVLSCAGLKGGDASDNVKDDGGDNKRRNDVGSGNNSIDVDFGFQIKQRRGLFPVYFERYTNLQDR